MVIVNNNTTISFNSRSPSGLRLKAYATANGMIAVSIHAAQAGCDADRVIGVKAVKVSIHAAQAGCDFIFITFAPIR